MPEKELTMPQAVAQSAELELAPNQIEATLNYIVDDGSKVFTSSPVPAAPTPARAVSPIRAA